MPFQYATVVVPTDPAPSAALLEALANAACRVIPATGLDEGIRAAASTAGAVLLIPPSAGGFPAARWLRAVEDLGPGRVVPYLRSLADLRLLTEEAAVAPYAGVLPPVRSEARAVEGPQDLGARRQWRHVAQAVARVGPPGSPAFRAARTVVSLTLCRSARVHQWRAAERRFIPAARATRRGAFPRTPDGRWRLRLALPFAGHGTALCALEAIDAHGWILSPDGLQRLPQLLAAAGAARSSRPRPDGRGDRATLLPPDFVLTLSHDVRSVSTALLEVLEGSSEALRARSAEAAEALNGLGLRTRGLVQNLDLLLDLARWAFCEGHDGPEPCLLEDVLEQAVGSALPLAPAPPRITLRVGPQVRRVRLDVARLHVAITNLLANAFRHTPRGGRVEVTAEGYHGRCVVCVRDTGPGLAPDDRALAFEPAAGAPSGWDRRGAGMGLALVRRLVEAAGGAVWAESEPGRGSRFYVALPYTPL